MKAFYIIAAAFLAAFASAQTLGPGQRMVHQQLLTWGSDSARELLFLGNAVYRDSANRGTVWKRTDNTADSCSNPVNVGGVDGNLYPVWYQSVSASIRSVDADSGTFILRTDAREFKGYSRGSKVYYGWMPRGKYASDSNVVPLDSITFPVVSQTTSRRQVGRFTVEFGDQLRFCPDDIAATANGTTDSMFVDSLLYRAR